MFPYWISLVLALLARSLYMREPWALATNILTLLVLRDTMRASYRGKLDLHLQRYQDQCPRPRPRPRRRWTGVVILFADS